MTRCDRLPAGATVGLSQPRGWPWIHPPARCSLIDSPTATHREVGDAAHRGQGLGRADHRRPLPRAARRAGEDHQPGLGATWPPSSPRPRRSRWPCRTRRSRSRRWRPTGLVDQLAPPLSVVRITPWPVRAPLRVLAVVPTTVHRTPGTPTRGQAAQWSWQRSSVVGAVVVGEARGRRSAPPVVVVGAAVVVGGARRSRWRRPPRQETPLR